MSYVLLWIETLLASLLFAAMLITAGLRRKLSIASILLYAAGLLLPLVPIGGVVATFAALRFGAGLRNSGFWWVIVLAACYLTGAIAILLRARRRDAVGMHQALSWPLARIATAWLVIVSLIAMTLWNLDLRAQMEIQALRAEAGAIALNAAPPQIPDAVNAAWVYEQADRQYKAAQNAADQRIDYRDLDSRSVEVRDYLNRQQKALATIRRAADMPQCRLDYDYGRPNLAAIMPRLNLFRAHAILLAVAANAEAANGSPDAALADCLRIYAIGQHANSSPLLIGELVTMGVDALAGNTVARVLPNVTAKEQMEHFPVPEPEVLSRGFARSLRSEEAFGLARFCDMGSGQSFQDELVAVSGERYPARATPSIGTPVWLLWVRDDVSIYREYLQRQRDIALQPYYQTADARKQIEEELRPGKRRGVMSAIVAPSVMKAIESLARAQALRSSVAVACAATRYRLDHGQYPATSDLLVPGYLEAMPVDPFDGQAMRIKKPPDGSLVIYSVGADGKDDGGVVDSPDSKTSPTDVGITLKMPARR